MPRGYRLAIIALGLTLLAHQGHSQEAEEPALESQPIAQSGESEGATNGDTEAAPEQNDTLSPISAIQGVETAIRDLVAAQNQEKDADEIQREKDDLDAQKKMALWAMLMLIPALGSVILTGVGVYLIWQTLLYTRDAVGEARSANEATKAMVALSEDTAQKELRAYVEIDSAEFQNSADAAYTNGRLVDCRVTIKNYGQTPAYNVLGFIFCRVDAIGGQWSFDAVEPSEIDTINTIGPGGIAAMTVTMRIERSDYPAIKNGEKGMFVWGGVSYRDSFNISREMEFRLVSTGDTYRRGKFSGCRDGNKST